MGKKYQFAAIFFKLKMAIPDDARVNFESI